MMLRVGTVTLDVEMATACIPQAYRHDIEPSTPGMLLEKHTRASSVFSLFCEIDIIGRRRGLSKQFTSLDNVRAKIQYVNNHHSCGSLSPLRSCFEIARLAFASLGIYKVIK